MSVDWELSEFVARTRFHDIPEDVLEFTKIIMMKTVAGMLYGSTVSSSKKFIRFSKTGKDEAGVIGCGFRTSIEAAAFINGVFAHAAELEDDCFPTDEFPGAGAVSDITVFPVIFSLADALKLSGEEVLEASVLACEVMNRVGHHGVGADNKSVEALGFTSLPFYGVIGSAVGASKALNLNPEQIRNALGLAIGTSSGFIVNFGTDAHYYESAMACSNGVMATYLAKDGGTGNPDIGKWLGSLLGVEKGEVSKISSGLAERWYTKHFWVKKYPVCFLMHRHLDIIGKLIKEGKIKHEQVEWIEAEVGPVDATVDRPEPKDLEDAKFSIQHVISCLLLDGEVGVDTISWRKIKEEKYKEFRKKVRVKVHNEWPKTFMSGVGRVRIRLSDGREITEELDQVIGGPKYPLSTDDFIKLYEKFTEAALNKAQIERSIEILLNIEKKRDLKELFDIIVFRR